jgi:hypothetical protein
MAMQLKATLTLNITPEELGRAVLGYALLRMTGSEDDRGREVFVTGGKVFWGDSVIGRDHTDVILVHAAKILMADGKGK